MKTLQPSCCASQLAWDAGHDHESQRGHSHRRKPRADRSISDSLQGLTSTPARRIPLNPSLRVCSPSKQAPGPKRHGPSRISLRPPAELTQETSAVTSSPSCHRSAAACPRSAPKPAACSGRHTGREGSYGFDGTREPGWRQMAKESSRGWNRGTAPAVNGRPDDSCCMPLTKSRGIHLLACPRRTATKEARQLMQLLCIRQGPGEEASGRRSRLEPRNNVPRSKAHPPGCWGQRPPST